MTILELPDIKYETIKNIHLTWQVLNKREVFKSFHYDTKYFKNYDENEYEVQMGAYVNGFPINCGWYVFGCHAFQWYYLDKKDTHVILIQQAGVYGNIGAIAKQINVERTSKILFELVNAVNRLNE